MSGEHGVVDALADLEVIATSLDEPRHFTVIFDRHAGVVFRFLIRRVGRDTADELLGETFRIAFERRATFDLTRESARPWLYGIATNLVAKHRRTEARRLRATALLAVERPSDSLADNVVALVSANHSWPDVARAIARLPDGERDALLLYAWEELSYDEIAVALEIPVGTVRSRLNRARTRLRELKVPSGEDPDTIRRTGRTRIAP
jgi:RNA polymerase sigma-70 factor (ECF subfamily)